MARAPQPRRRVRRLRRTACIVLGAAAVVSGAMIPLSLWCYASTHRLSSRHDIVLVVREGTVIVIHRSPGMGPASGTHWDAWVSRPNLPHRLPMLAFPRVTQTATMERLDVPLWLIAVPSGIGSLLLWRSLRRMRIDGAAACAGCGYSLVGLAEGAACPECEKGGESRPSGSV